jgi:hypothetical protein
LFSRLAGAIPVFVPYRKYEKQNNDSDNVGGFVHSPSHTSSRSRTNITEVLKTLRFLFLRSERRI